MLISSKLLHDWLWTCGVFPPELLFFLPGLGRAQSVCTERRIIAWMTTLTRVQLWERGILCVQYDRPEWEVHPWVYCLILNPFSLRNATQYNQTTIHHKHNAMHVVLRNGYSGMIWPLSTLFSTVLAWSDMFWSILVWSGLVWKLWPVCSRANGAELVCSGTLFSTTGSLTRDCLLLTYCGILQWYSMLNSSTLSLYAKHLRKETHQPDDQPLSQNHIFMLVSSRPQPVKGHLFYHQVWWCFAI